MTTNTLKTLAASAAALATMTARPDVDWTLANSERDDGKLTKAAAVAYAKHWDSIDDANRNSPMVVEFDPSDGRTWIDRDAGLTPDIQAKADSEAAQAHRGMEKATVSLDGTMALATRVYAAKIGIKSGEESTAIARRLDPFSKGMRKAFPLATKESKTFAGYVSHLKKMLSYAIIPGETQVKMPCVRYTKGQDGSSIKTLEHTVVTVDSVSQWRQDFWIEPKSSGTGLWCPAFSKEFKESPTALRDAKARISGERAAASQDGDKGSEILDKLAPSDATLVREVADELRRAAVVGCLERVRSILADAVAEAEKAAEERAAA